jgi:dolichol-phosphate mannosyltransferase
MPLPPARLIEETTIKRSNTLIFIPTYNERENVENMCRELLGLNLGADIMFLDDNSPDGTGQILDALAEKHPEVSVVHRPGKLGIGTAHQDGINRAYEMGYERLITMDCDFTHSPADVLRLVEASQGYDVTVGSRYMGENSLPGWNLFRRSLTKLGHGLTSRLLQLKYDATGALRVYNLKTIPRGLFGMVVSRGYSFFFESLFLMVRNGLKVREVPIVLPARTYGHSKMSIKEMFKSLQQLGTLSASTWSNPSQFRYVERGIIVDPKLVDPQGWDDYWKSKQRTSTFAYEVAAAVYRNLTLKGRLNHFIRKHFATHSKLLHAGCGGGQVDQDIQRDMHITPLDISVPALQLYQRNNPDTPEPKHGDILALPFEADTFDGVYNLGVMEHFTREQIDRILLEFRRVLKPGGKLLIFWPYQHATSVLLLNTVHYVLNDVLHKNVKLHPAEISLLKGRKQAESYIARAGFDFIDYYFGARDGLIQAVIVAQKPAVDRAPV